MNMVGPDPEHPFYRRAPWAAKRLRALGIAIRDGAEVPPDCPSYREVMEWYANLALLVQTEIDSLDWDALLCGREYRVTSRPKTLDTLREKLERDHGTPLPSIQDVAGVRFEADMTLSEQDAVAQAIAGMFLQPPSSIHDLREAPHAGYRAVHVWIRLPDRVEVQVRTALQGEWANAYESFADFAGRGVRYGETPQDDHLAAFMVALQGLSVPTLAQLESDRDSYDLEARQHRDGRCWPPGSAQAVPPDAIDREIARRLGEFDGVKVRFESGLREIRDGFDRLAAERRPR